MKKIFLAFCLIILSSRFVFADTITINHFVVKANPLNDGEVAVIATDSLDRKIDDLSGVFLFTLNGFDDTLKFHRGTAYYGRKIERSTFLYVRHLNDSGTHSALYYIFKNGGFLKPIHISWVLMLGIPCLLVLLAYMFKRFIIVAIVIFAVFMYFNYHSGLSIPTFFQSIVDGLKNLV